jgi:cytochrome c biogenesis protein CcdA
VDYIGELEALVEESNSRLRVEYLESNYLARNELKVLFDELEVPTEYRGSVAVAFEGRMLFINYVPVESISEFLGDEVTEEGRYVVHWDELEGLYTVIDGRGGVYECEGGSFTECVEPAATRDPNAALIVVISGLLDGVNPCAFTVLVFMITILYTLQSMNEEDSHLVLRVGSAYIVAVYLGYLAIGLALFQAVTVSGASWLFARAGAVLLFVLGLINVRDSLRKGKPSLGVPEWAWGFVRLNFRKASMPAAFVAGLLVSVVEFPCTGGVYLSIMGMLASETSYALGLAYLVLYNVAFVFPLILVAGVMLFRGSESFSLVGWGVKEKRLRLFSGLFFMGLSLYMLLKVLG